MKIQNQMITKENGRDWYAMNTNHLLDVGLNNLKELDVINCVVICLFSGCVSASHNALLSVGKVIKGN